ncbi:glycosyltransferase [Paenibacillus sp. PSB04]|uniref:glycosyltransferase n=1 Tax=Paenibacillus sp. PSB04 TaxID=2866810 RepID=UPI0021F1B182|nr:glycosyltransferase [Paenibacillus sp. PSB04]UYO05192.1 glycosyltransferase [Paenibacillus sp. PSB04]
MNKTSIILPSLPGQFEYLKDAIESIRRFTDKGTYELIVVDSSGSDKSRTWLAEQTDVRTLFMEHDLSLGGSWNTGMQAAVGENLVVMHADILVTPNWLTSLAQILEQDKALGAVEPTTNNGTENSQVVPDEFDSMEDMIVFAQRIQQPQQFEERLVLSDVCLLMKKTVVDTIGLFDEQLQGKAMIADYCLRIKQVGWKLGLCKHVFIHHYGEEEPNEAELYRSLFLEKWQFSLENTSNHSNILRLIKRPSASIFKILILGTGITATSIKLKQLFPNAEIYGCHSIHDYVPELHGFGTFCSSATYLTFDTLDQQVYDYIIISPDLELVELLPTTLKLLANHGQLLTEMANANHYTLVKRILLGEGLRSVYKYWNLADIPPLFERAGFQELDFDYVTSPIKKQDSSLITSLGELVEQLPPEFAISSFLITASKVPRDEVLHPLFSELLINPGEEVLSSIFSSPTSQLLSSLERYNDGPNIPLLNYLGISNFERNQVDDVLPFLNKAYELDPSNPSTLLNLATVMYSFGEDEAALVWLERLEEKDEKVLQWMREIEHGIYERKLAANKVKFLLRRIENDVEREEACNELLQLIRNGVVSVDNIIQSVEMDIIHKTDTLNRVAVNCFTAGEYELVIPLLQHSYSLDSSNEDTLFNLGYILYKFNSYHEALEFLMQIGDPDEDAYSLQLQIERIVKNAGK